MLKRKILTRACPFRSFLPYALQQLPNGSFVVLNRNYKPLGFNTSHRVRYEDYPITYRSRLNLKRLAQAIGAEPPQPHHTCVFFYNDTSCPIALHGSRNFNSKLWIAYCKKLEKFARLTVRVEPQQEG